MANCEGQRKITIQHSLKEKAVELPKFGSAINKLSSAATFVAVAYETANAAYNDCENRTTRNTVTSVTNVISGLGGSSGGASIGSAIGTAILPGIGTVVGGMLGSIVGGIFAAIIADAILNKIADELNYDIINVECKCCGKQFKMRLYKGHRFVRFCEDCNK